MNSNTKQTILMVVGVVVAYLVVRHLLLRESLKRKVAANQPISLAELGVV